jgi:hypothetical protein
MAEGLRALSNQALESAGMADAVMLILLVSAVAAAAGYAMLCRHF